ncbi:MAG: GNAT family N-acetyltransferase [Acidobacteriota bacterium]
MHTNHEWTRGEHTISTDTGRLDLEVIHQFLTGSYWAAGVPREVVQRSIEHSLPFGLYNRDRQIGFARVVTDYATFAYLADVFVLDEFRGEGLGKWLIEVVTTHPELSGLRRWMLATRDAHGLYGKSGFVELGQPERWMEKHAPNAYSNSDPISESP